MTDILTGFGIINSEAITHWQIDVKKHTEKFTFRAMAGPTALCTLVSNGDELKSIDFTSMAGLISESILYVLEESERTKKPCHLWRANGVAKEVMLIAGEKVAEGEVSSNETLRKILLSEGAYVTIGGIDGFFTRVGAYMFLQEITPSEPILVQIHYPSGPITDLSYLPSVKVPEKA